MRVLVTGAGGQVGQAIVRAAAARSASSPREKLHVTAAPRSALDVTRRDSVMSAFENARPDVVVHAAAWTAVDACEADARRALATNALGTRNVAEACDRAGAHLCYLSTDYVFDGLLDRPYTEWDRPNPLSAYGRSKLGGELEVAPGSTIVRTSWVCGRHGANMVKTVLRLASEERPLRFVDDQRGSPTVAEDLAPVVLDLALGRRRGIYHVTNSGETTWCGFARAVVEAAGLDPARVEAISTAGLDPPRAAPRPPNSVLDNMARRLSGEEPLPHWKESVGRLVADLLV